MKFLSLDISSSRIGWAIFENSELIKYGCVDLTKIKTGHFSKMDVAAQLLGEIASENQVEYIGAEKALEKVSSNSTAHTVNVLIAFNFCLTYLLSRKLKNMNISYLEFSKARSNAGLKFPRGSDAKKIVRDYVEKKYPKVIWEFTKGNIRYKPTYKQKCFDIADAILLGQGLWNLNVFTEKNTDNKENISAGEREED